MKTPSFRRHRGFTLVELLVVIAIIAVLAAAGFGAGNMAITKAKSVTALAVAQSVDAAVNSFYTDNSALPVPQGAASSDGGTSFDTGKETGIKVLEILTGLEKDVNPRQVKYLTLKEGKSKKNGIFFSPSGKEITGLFDPWGNPYTIVLDTNYEERIKVKTGKSELALNGRRSAVSSPGSDKKWGTKDDIKTW